MSAILGNASAAAVRDSPGLWALAWRRLLQDRVGMVCLVIVAAYLAMMVASYTGLVAGDWSRERGVSYANPSFLAGEVNLEAKALEQRKAAAKAPPVDLSDVDPLAPRYKEWAERAAKIAVHEVKRSQTLPFGGDKWGRDVLLKTVKGSEVSIFVGLSSALLATLIGTVLGALAGYWGGRVNDLLEWFYNIFTSIPYILLILAFAAVATATGKFGKGIVPIVLVLSLTGWTGIYRLMRAEYIKHCNREYVKAAQAIGASNTSRMFHHILPNVSHVALVQLSQYTVGFIKAEVILSFLGFGVPVDMVSWGTMLAEAQNELVIGKWWQLVAAGASMAVLVTAFSLLTDSLRDALDPKLR
ncbi:MAG TPA: ABC transporter permease [Usitatibacter sp.]|nr:ABC transporter permease [Usitatibacter sp.]